MKKFIAILMICAAIFSFTSCKKSESPKDETLSDMERIQKQLLTMENYACISTVEHISDNNTKTYEMKQYYKKTGEYRLEMIEPESVKGIITVYDGKTISQYNPRIKGEIKKDIEPSIYVDEMFLGAFVKNYFKSEDTVVTTSKFDASKCTILETTIPGEHKYLSTEKLWVDNETLIPKQLIIYDVDGKERVKVTYGEFKYNVKFTDNIFNISKEE